MSVEQTDDICSTVTDLALWREVLVTWRANGYKPRIGNLLDRYRKDAVKASARPPTDRPPLPIMQPSRPDNALPTDEIARRLLAARQGNGQ